MKENRLNNREMEWKKASFDLMMSFQDEETH